MDDNWTLEPQVGLGQLKFDMVPADVGALNAVYGELEGEVSDKVPSEVIQDTDDFLSKYFSEEELAEDEEYKAEQARGEGKLTQTLADSALVLDYADGRLSEIIMASQAIYVSFRGVLVFDTPTTQLLAILETTNGAPGRYASTGAAFDSIGVYLDGFTERANLGPVTILPQTDDRFVQRTLSIRKEPYSIAEFLPGAKPQSFL